MNCIPTSTVTTKKKFCKAECETAGYYYGGKSGKSSEGYYTGTTETKSSKSANMYEKVCTEQIIITDSTKSGKSVEEVVSRPPPAPTPELIETPAPIEISIETPAPVLIETPAPVAIETPAPMVIVTPAPIDETPAPTEIITPAPQIDEVVTYEPTIITTTGSTPTVATSSEYDGVEMGDRNPQ